MHPEQASRGTILIVDADGLSRLIADQVLRHRGYRTLSAASVAEALRLCADPTMECDLAVLDIENTGVAGPAVLEQLRRRFPGLPAVYVGRPAMVSRPPRDPDSTSDAIVVKPFGVASFISAIRDKLEPR